MSGFSRPRLRLTPSVGPALAFGVLAIIAVGLATLALIPNKPTAAAQPRSTIRVTDLTNAVFIGDSYTQGVGASGPAARWVTLVSGKEGWEPDNLGRGGTGYLAAGAPSECGLAKCENYVGMVALAVEMKPNFVVVSGGQSDFEVFMKNPGSVISSIDSTYNSLRTGLPDTPIYAIGPSTTGPVTKQILAFDAAVRAAAEHVGATYVSLLQPNVIAATFIAADREHVNDAGHATIAARVEQTIKK